MSYDEQRISDQIDGGLHKMKEMEKKQTAVQFLLSHIADEGKDMIGRDILEQAIQMERDQIEEAFVAGGERGTKVQINN